MVIHARLVLTMKKRSPFSATEIGLNPPIGNGELIRSHFREESKGIIQHLTGVHHARKLGHMQVNYADTVSKLSEMQVRKPVTLSGTMNNSNNHTSTVQTASAVPSSSHNNNGSYNGSYNNTSMNKIMKMNEFNDTMKANIASEHQLNARKRLYNREVGRKAVVTDIMVGKGPMPKYVLFAQKMNHNQILAMTGALAAPDARLEPQSVPVRKRWISEEQGWETN